MAKRARLQGVIVNGAGIRRISCGQSMLPTSSQSSIAASDSIRSLMLSGENDAYSVVPLNDWSHYERFCPAEAARFCLTFGQRAVLL
jgi:hypothetical protein